MATTKSVRRRRIADAEPGSRGGAETREALREALLQAARQRFLHYGYKKTTIEEIAADANIGKGTVYLYFDSKDEILLTLVLGAKRHITERMQTIAVSAATPENKLRGMIRACILCVWDACMTTAHGNELVDAVHPQLVKRPEMMEQFREETGVQRDLFANVLAQGNRSGVFSIADPSRAAQLFLTAFMAFFPPYKSRFCAMDDTRDGLERGVEEMTEFLLSGIRRR